MFWLYSRNIPAEYWNTDAAQYNCRLICLILSSRLQQQSQASWMLLKSISRPTTESSASGWISRVSYKAADSTKALLNCKNTCTELEPSSTIELGDWLLSSLQTINRSTISHSNRRKLSFCCSIDLLLIHERVGGSERTLNTNTHPCRRKKFFKSLVRTAYSYKSWLRNAQ